MHLRNIYITNFRSIKKCSLAVDKVLALVGENNSGKSAVLRALNAFFNFEHEQADFLNGKHLYTQKSKPTVRLTFGGDISGFEQETDLEYLAVEVVFDHGKRTVKVRSGSKYKAVSETVIERIKEKIDYYFIPPIRDYKNLEWAESTTFKRLAEDFLYKATEKRDNYTPRFTDAAEYLEKNGLGRLAKYIREMYNVNSKFDFKLAFSRELSFINFIGGLRFLVDEKNSVHEISECGAGVQSLTIIAIHRALAAINGKNVILGLEEPETNLHPQAQREVIRSLKKHVEDENDMVDQVIFTTHSTVMIDSIDHTEAALFRKVTDEIRGIKTIVSQLPSEFYAKYGLQEYRYYQFHRYRNSDFFYSKLVIIVESKNDGQAIQEIMRKDGVELDDLGVSIVNLESVDNIKFAVSIVKELGLPYLIVVDKDYFLPYECDMLKSSRDNQGFPKYRKEYKSNHLEFIEKLVPVKKERDDLLPLLFGNHTAALQTLSKYGIVCMRWSTEIDLASSIKGRELFYEECAIPHGKRSSKELLEQNSSNIKKVEKITAVIRKLPRKNYPQSFSKLRETLKDKLSAIS